MILIPPNYQGAPSYFMDFIFKIDPIWEVVLDARPDTVYENKIQTITNKTNIETLDATVQNNLSLPNIGELAFNVYNLKYLVSADDNKAKWITDLAAPNILARESFTLTQGAASGRVLTCVDSSGLAEWSDVEQVEAVHLMGDVTGMSNNNQVDFVGGGIPVSELLTLSKLPNLAGDVIGPFVDNEIHTLGKGTINVSDLVTKQLFPSLLPPIPTLPILSGDVTGDYDNNTIWTLGGGTIDVNKLMTEAKLLSLLPRLPTLAGDVTGTLSDNKVLTLNGGTIPVTSLVTATSTTTLTNKTINHSSNTIGANILRSALWSATIGGAAPAPGNTIFYNGSEIIWVNPETTTILSGDVTGYLRNTVVAKATGDFTVGRIHRLPNKAQIKKLCILDYGVADNVNDHNFQGLGTSNLMLDITLTI